MDYYEESPVRGRGGRRGEGGDRGYYSGSEVAAGAGDSGFVQRGMIYAYGDHADFLSYNVEDMVWEKRRFDNNAKFTGTLKYMAAATLLDGRIILTGGCLVSSGEATNTCYEVSAAHPQKNARKKDMRNKRYAHCSPHLNGYVFVIGGFDNKDSEDVSPNTLALCEKFSP